MSSVPASAEAPAGPPQTGKAAKPTPVVPRIIPAIPLPLSKKQKKKKQKKKQQQQQQQQAKEENGIVTPEKSDASDTSLSGLEIAHSDSHLTPKSTPSAVGNPAAGFDTPAESVSDDAISQRDHDNSHSLYGESTTSASSIPFSLSNNDMTMKSPTSDSSASTGGPAVIVSHVQSRVSDLVFGGVPDSSSPSPAPFTNSNHHLAPYPSVGDFYPRGMMYQPFGQSYSIHTAPYVPPPTHFNPEANLFAPMEPNPHMNGNDISRSASQNSSQPVVASSHKPPIAISPLDISSLNGYSQVPQSVQFVDALLLRDYMVSAFRNGDFADCTLHISHPVAPAVLDFPAHSVVLARSPTLMALLQAQRSENNLNSHGQRILHLEVSDKFLTPYGIVEAIGSLYGLPLPAFDKDAHDVSFRGEVASNSQYAVQSMSRALEYAAAGRFLKLTALAVHGIESAKQLLQWDNLESALAFALDGGISPRDWHSDPTIDPSANGFYGRPTYEELSSQMQHVIFQYIRYRFPQDFELNPSAPQLVESPRLPAVIDSKPSISDPRLTQIQFGDVPLEDPSSLDSSTYLLSSILISLPFPPLKALLEDHFLGEKLGWPKVVEIMHTVIDEREHRRAKALKSKRVMPSSSKQLWEETNWEERVKPSAKHMSGHVIVRSRKADEPGKAELKPRH